MGINVRDILKFLARIRLPFFLTPQYTSCIRSHVNLGTHMEYTGAPTLNDLPVRGFKCLTPVRYHNDPIAKSSRPNSRWQHTSWATSLHQSLQSETPTTRLHGVLERVRMSRASAGRAAHYRCGMQYRCGSGQPAGSRYRMYAMRAASPAQCWCPHKHGVRNGGC